MGVSVLRNLRVREGSAVDEGANQHAVICLTKRRAPTVTEAEIKKLQADLEKATADLAKANAAVTKANAEIETLKKAQAPKVEPTQDEVEKALPESVRAELKKAREDREKAREDREAMAKKLDAEIAKRETAEWIAKVKGYGMVGADPGKLAPVLRKAAVALDAAELEELEKAFRAQGAIAAQVAKLTKASGTAGELPENSAEAKLEKRIGELRKSDAKLSYAEAYTKAFEEAVEADPAAYNTLTGKEA